MTTSAGDVEVVDVPAENRFVVRHDRNEAELVYHLRGERLVLLHTEVPDEMSGQGIGGHLVRAALSRARSDRLTIVPWCPFARRWLHEHPDAAAGLSIDWESLPPTAE
jgi:predicted GNAT family acetyltransferase